MEVGGWTLGVGGWRLGVGGLELFLRDPPTSIPCTCMASPPLGGPKIYQHFIKKSTHMLVDFFIDFRCNLASNLDQNSSQNQQNSVLKPPLKKQLKILVVEVENKCFQSWKI